MTKPIDEKPKCNWNEDLVESSKGVYECVNGLALAKENDFGGAFCRSGFVRTGEVVDGKPVVICDPCDSDLYYTCPETGSKLQKTKICPDHTETYNEDDINESAEAAWVEGLRALHDLCGRGCSVPTLSMFYKECEKWKAQIAASNQHLTRMAEYQCQTPTSVGRETASESTVTKEIVIDLPGNATKETIRAEFEAAARKLEKTIAGCWNVHFERVLNETPTPPPQIPEAVKKAAVAKQAAADVIEDPCVGPWKNRPICKK